jgi:hypothetical protein
MRIWPPALLREHAARKAELDARVQAAEKEKRLSGARLEGVRREVTGPLHAKGRHNQFAAMIRNSLMEGYER